MVYKAIIYDTTTKIRTTPHPTPLCIVGKLACLISVITARQIDKAIIIRSNIDHATRSERAIL